MTQKVVSDIDKEGKNNEKLVKNVVFGVKCSCSGMGTREATVDREHRSGTTRERRSAFENPLQLPLPY